LTTKQPFVGPSTPHPGKPFGPAWGPFVDGLKDYYEQKMKK
jgi:hypothetical protein